MQKINNCTTCGAREYRNLLKNLAGPLGGGLAQKAYKKESDNAAIAFTIKPGEKFNAISGNVHIKKLGIITFNIPSIKPSIYLLLVRKSIYCPTEEKEHMICGTKGKY